MIPNLSSALKNTGKLSLGLILMFFVGVLISAYTLFTLPHQLVIKGGLPSLELAWPVLITLFVSVGTTFVLAFAAIQALIRTRKETIVYIEKKTDEQSTAATREEIVGGLDFVAFKNELKLAKGEEEFLQTGLNTLCQQLQAGQGAIYLVKQRDEKRSIELTHGFAVSAGESSAPHFEWGEGLIGQAAAGGKSLYLDEIPEGYITVVSGLGTASPRYLVIIPMKSGEQVKGVVEIATFSPIRQEQLSRLDEMVQVLVEKIK